jgi:hypothetical protein
MTHRWKQINTDELLNRPFLSVFICVYLWLIIWFIVSFLSVGP